MKTTYTVAGRHFRLEPRLVEEALADELPDPIRDHFVVVRGRRFPPKQVLSAVTGLDRADFTTHQARRILMRLGFTAGRQSGDGGQGLAGEARAGLPYGGRQADALAPYIGKWVALGEPTEVLVAADTPQEVLAWLAKHGRRATGGMFRVPATEREAEGLAPL
jgi:hypothetical protein